MGKGSHTALRPCIYRLFLVQLWSNQMMVDVTVQSTSKQHYDPAATNDGLVSFSAFIKSEKETSPLAAGS